MLIVSLPPVHCEDLLKEIITHPLVGAVRYNTGTSSAFDPEETIRRIQKHAEPAEKPVYIDLKAKQLRVDAWSCPPYGPVVLNHRIKVSLPAKVYFRGDHNVYELKEIADGNKIYVDPVPKWRVGEGQAVNIVAGKIEYGSRLLPLDYAYIEEALKAGLTRFMLSFVENLDDIKELEEAMAKHIPKKDFKKVVICLKIESLAGLDFINNLNPAVLRKYRLVAARDDLMIQIGALNMPRALKIIIGKDPRAICASRLLLGLERDEGDGEVSLADVSDLEYMKDLGYKAFMFSDGISHYHFREAINFWEKYEQVKLD